MSVLSVVNVRDRRGLSGERERSQDQKMTAEPLTRSELFVQLRKELFGEERSTFSKTHIFVILGASVSTTSLNFFCLL